jgi:hypothetical protein
MQPSRDAQRRLDALLHEAAILSRMHRALPLAAAILDAEIARTRRALATAAEAAAPGSTRSDPPPAADGPLPPLPAGDRDGVQPPGVGATLPAGSGGGSAGGGGGGSSSTTATVAATASNMHQGISPAISAAAAGAVGARKRIRLKVPAEKYPEYNFVGRLLGPRGATLKKLERDTGCKIMIRGRGSIRKDKEADVRGKPGWEHVFNENLHVVIEVSDAPDEPYAARALTLAKEAVELLLVPVPEEKDSLKRQQLRDLAILNGTFRASDSPAAATPAAAFNVLPQALSTPHHHARAADVHAASLAAAAAALGHAHAVDNGRGHAQDHGLGHSVGLPHSLSHSHAGHGHGHGHGHPPPPASPILRAVHRSASATAGGSGGGSGSGSGGSTRLTGGLAGIGGLAGALRIPSLDIEAMSESFLASPPATVAGGMPAPSPTIVDPEMYPFPPTPSLMSADSAATGTTFGSPIWSPMHVAPSAPPPMPSPLHQNSHTNFSLAHHQPPLPASSPSPASSPPPPRSPGPSLVNQSQPQHQYQQHRRHHQDQLEHNEHQHQHQLQHHLHLQQQLPEQRQLHQQLQQQQFHYQQQQQVPRRVERHLSGPESFEDGAASRPPVHLSPFDPASGATDRTTTASPLYATSPSASGTPGLVPYRASFAHDGEGRDAAAADGGSGEDGSAGFRLFPVGLSSSLGPSPPPTPPAPAGVPRAGRPPV